MGLRFCIWLPLAVGLCPLSMLGSEGISVDWKIPSHSETVFLPREAESILGQDDSRLLLEGLPSLNLDPLHVLAT